MKGSQLVPLCLVICVHHVILLRVLGGGRKGCEGGAGRLHFGLFGFGSTCLMDGVVLGSLHAWALIVVFRPWAVLYCTALSETTNKRIICVVGVRAVLPCWLARKGCT